MRDNSAGKKLSVTDKKAVASFVLSTMGLIVFFAFPAQLIAFYLGLSARKSVRMKSLALCGTIFSVIGLIATFLFATFIALNFKEIIESKLFFNIVKAFEYLL